MDSEGTRSPTGGASDKTEAMGWPHTPSGSTRFGPRFTITVQRNDCSISEGRASLMTKSALCLLLVKLKSQNSPSSGVIKGKAYCFLYNPASPLSGAAFPLPDCSMESVAY